MKFVKTPLSGAFEIDIVPRGDERGFFARLFCQDELVKQGLEPRVRQVNNSLSVEAGTLRGLHYQVAPYGETKLVRCISGEIFDVILDLREGSPTFRQWHGVTLTAENRKMLFVPRGFAHGFLTLKPNTEIIYLVSEVYEGPSERVVRWDDPQFSIAWPIEPKILSDKDRLAPLFSSSTHQSGY